MTTPNDSWIELNEENQVLCARIAELEEALRYAIKQVPELATVPGIAALNLD